MKKRKIKSSTVADFLTLIAMVIVFITSFVLNKYFGMYILSALMLIVSYFVVKEGGN